MTSLKCRGGPLTSRAIRPLTPGLLLSFLSAASACLWSGRPARAEGPILPPDAAARAFQAGRDAVRKGNNGAGIQRLEEALATGYTKPEEHFGTSRYAVDRYDPDYWLGVAYMQEGDDLRAKEHLLRSKAGGLVERWPEYADLTARLATLDRREAARRRPPAPAPSPTPPPILPPPEQVEAFIPPTGGESASAPVPTPAAAPSGGTPEPSAPLTDRDDARAVVAALSKADWPAADASLALLLEKNPGAKEADLLAAVVSASRYLLEGRRDPSFLARARRSLAAYRQRGGSKKAEEVWISPALGAVLY